MYWGFHVGNNIIIERVKFLVDLRINISVVKQ